MIKLLTILSRSSRSTEGTASGAADTVTKKNQLCYLTAAEKELTADQQEGGDKLELHFCRGINKEWWWLEKMVLCIWEK